MDDDQESTPDNAERLKHLRQLLGLSQRQLAAEFNVSPGAIANWESGTRPLPGSILRLVEMYEENLGMTERPALLNRINAGWAERTLRSGLTSARLMSRLASSQIKQLVAGNEKAQAIKQATDQLLAKHLVSSLGEMKGLAMKLGQMMSYMNFALPESMRHALETLGDTSSPMSPSVIEKILTDAWGESPVQRFAYWEPFPFAAASIGQVHRARLHDGTEVAVKIQYPDITNALKSDLKNAALIERLSQNLFRYQDKGAFVDELSQRLLEECDYRLEAQRTQRFRALFADDPTIVIPKVYNEHSTASVLVTEYCHGLKLRDFVKVASQTDRDKAGFTIFRFTFTSIFKHGLFHCDPNSGNFLFADGKVIFLDFGCVKTFDPHHIDQWKKISAANLLDDDDALFEAATECGFFPRPERIDRDHQLAFLKALYDPWRKDRVYRFTKSYVENTWRLGFADNPDRFKLALPRDWVFTNRLQWGLCALLAELGAQANWHTLWCELTEFERYRGDLDALRP